MVTHPEGADRSKSTLLNDTEPVPLSDVDNAGLPPELLKHIFQYCDYATFKALRLVSHIYERLTSPQVFEHVIVVNHFDSIQKLTNIAHSPRLKRLVRHINYNAAWRDAIRIMTCCMNEGPRIEDVDKLARLRSHFDRVCAADERLVKSRNIAHHFAHMAIFQDIFANLPFLESIKIDEGDVDTFLDTNNLPAFLAKLFEGCDEFVSVATLIKEMRANRADDREALAFPLTMSLIAAMRHCAPSMRSFEIWNTPWEGPDKNWCTPHLFKPVSLHQNLLARLTRFVIGHGPGYRMHLLDNIDSTPVDNLRGFLALMNDLEDLTLILNRGSYEPRLLGTGRRVTLIDWSGHETRSTRYHAHRTLMQQLSQYPKIRYLHLDGLICTFSELKSVLGKSRGLRSLSLSSLMLLPERSDDELRQPCLVKCLKWIGSRLKLCHFEVNKFWSNRGCQRWQINAPDAVNKGMTGTTSTLWHRVIDFVLTGGECPLNDVEIPEDYFDLGRPNNDLRWQLPTMFTQKQYLGDATWDMRFSYVKVPAEDWIDKLAGEYTLEDNYLCFSRAIEDCC